jgi:hypothetical protein
MVKTRQKEPFFAYLYDEFVDRACHVSFKPIIAQRSQTTTTATTLPTSRIRRSRSNVLNTPNLHARTSQSAKSRLSTWTGSLGSVSTRGSDLDVQSSDSEFLAACSDVLGCQHGGIGGGLVAVGFDFHAARDSADGFAATGITQNVSL